MDSDGREAPPPGTATRYCFDDRFEHIREFLASKDVDMHRPCTFDSDGDCWLAGTLPPWNKILSAVCLELIQLRPTTLSLRSYDHDPKGNTSVKALRCGAYLFTWLPKRHACVQSIRLRGIWRRPVFALKMPLQSSAHLRHLTLEGRYSKAFSECDLWEGMTALKTLETFEFLKIHIKSRNLARGIAALLRENGRHLVKVRFEENNLSQHSTAIILRALHQCQVLSELSFNRNNLNKDNIETLAVVLRSLRDLKKMTLESSISEIEVFGPIAKVLQSNASLEELNLRRCYIQCELLFEALHTNTTLRLLNLNFCTMTSNDVMHLATALSFNKGLRTVLLRHCRWTGERIEVLANAMAINDTLETLDLSNDCWTTQDVIAFCRTLTDNNTRRSVVFGRIVASDEERMVLSHEMGQLKCYHRIAMQWADADLTPLTMELEADAQYLLELDLSFVEDFTCSLLGPLFNALACNTMIRALKFRPLYPPCHLGGCTA
ncbi:hypothetical protein MTO96_037311 [Rhipicephalus appendiculatus]